MADVAAETGRQERLNADHPVPALQRDDSTRTMPGQEFSPRHLLSAVCNKPHVRHRRRTREQRR
jgi:hypothetical protein